MILFFPTEFLGPPAVCQRYSFSAGDVRMEEGQRKDARDAYVRISTRTRVVAIRYLNYSSSRDKAISTARPVEIRISQLLK